MGTDMSWPSGPAPLRTWSISTPTIAITLPSKRSMISRGSGSVLDVHHTCEYVLVMGPWYASNDSTPPG